MADPDTKDWLGLPAQFKQPYNHGMVAYGTKPVTASLGQFMNPQGDQVAGETTEVSLWYDDHALHLFARCTTSAMERVRDIVTKNSDHDRDTWGDDALEIQIDVGLTRDTYLHFILPPTGIPATYRGFNNRQLQGWHPDFDFQVTLREEEWTVEASFPFAILDGIPDEGERWGLNLMRVNPSEPAGYAQWAPTFGDALRPELFGQITFLGTSVPPDTTDETAVPRYSRYAEERRSYFLKAINGIEDEDVLDALGIGEWASWSEHLSTREGLLPLRWDGIRSGAEGIPTMDQPLAMQAAESLIQEQEQWSAEPAQLDSSFALKLEALGDAYLLEGEPRYVGAFEEAIRIFEQFMKPLLAATTSFQHIARAESPYHDYQIIRAGLLAYAYLSLRKESLTVETHSAMMKAMLRAGRFAVFNVRAAYNFGNHQIYESAGLAILALLFPEFQESDDWALVAARSIRIHLERETFADGGYLERCGYHSVAMNYVMQTVSCIRANSAEARFEELMRPETLSVLERMHEWVLRMSPPCGVMPAFGDYGSHSQTRFFQRGATLFSRQDFAWPVKQIAPELVPDSIKPSPPAELSVSMDESEFTVMRDGWDRDSFYMAVDHGPLGGQHSHVDAMGFVAWAGGQPIALDSGIGLSYSDPLYITWYRKVRAHNVVAIDDVEPEKVVKRTFWQSDRDADFLEMRSRGYEHSLGILHDRTIVFLKGVGWMIHDKLSRADGVDMDAHLMDWLLHTPFELTQVDSGILDGRRNGKGLIVMVADADKVDALSLTQNPASVLPLEYAALRQTDFMRHHGSRLIQDVTCLTMSKRAMNGPVEFAVFLLPYEGERPDARFRSVEGGWELDCGDGREIAVKGRGIIPTRRPR